MAERVTPERAMVDYAIYTYSDWFAGRLSQPHHVSTRAGKAFVVASQTGKWPKYFLGRGDVFLAYKDSTSMQPLAVVVLVKTHPIR